MNLILRIIILALVCNTASFANIRILSVSDIHYGSKNSSQDGSDSGYQLLTLSLNKVRQLSKNADFILYLGDLPTHLFGYSPNKAGYEQAVFHGLYAANVLKKPMFYISGNNDPIGGDYQPFVSRNTSPLMNASEWNGACVHCEGLIIDKSAMDSGGYYSVYPVPKNKKLMLIVLNTTQWMRPHWYAPKYPNQDQDAQAQLLWLQKQLKKPSCTTSLDCHA